jgi:hypothetical protein
MDRYWVPPSRLIGTETVRVVVFDPGDALSAAGATGDAVRAYAERRLGAEGARVMWERNETADDPVLALSFIVADLEEVDQAGYMISFTLEMRQSLPVERSGDDYTTPIFWMANSLCYAPRGALANAFWPHLGGLLDEFAAAWRLARYRRLDIPAQPPVPALPEWLDDADEAALSERRFEFERLLDSAGAGPADGPIADRPREPHSPAVDAGNAAGSPPPPAAIYYVPLHVADTSPAVEPPHRAARPAPRRVPRTPAATVRRPRCRRRGRPKV